MKPSPHHRSRRRILLGSAGACAALGVGLWFGGRARDRQLVSRTSRALGSAVTLTALHPDRAIASAAVDAAFAELERIENVMSLYRPESQLSRLNRDGFLADPDPSLVEVLRFASEMSALSGGAFDITVQPLWALHAEAHRIGRGPDKLQLQAARATVDWRRVEVGPDRIALRGEGTAVTLNGIAQGFATDAAMRAMRTHGIVDALIDTGELGAIGRDRVGDAWSIGIQHPRQEDAYAAVVRLEDRCLATSGDYETTFSRDFTRNHVFDPRTGSSPGELASVSVLAPSGMAADALSTSLLVTGPQRGMDLLRSFPGTDALVILKDGSRLMTPGFPSVA